MLLVIHAKHVRAEVQTPGYNRVTRYSIIRIAIKHVRKIKSMVKTDSRHESGRNISENI